MARKSKAKSGDEEEISDIREPDVRGIVTDAQFTLGVIGKIIIIFFLISVVIGGVLLTRNKVVREKISSIKKPKIKKTVSEQPIYATFSWTLEPHQYGDKRTSGPEEARITRDDSAVFNFLVDYTHKGRRQVSIFEGEKVSPNRIEGHWRQEYPKDGGEWYLEPDPVNPRLYRGKHSDMSLEWTPIELRIKLK